MQSKRLFGVGIIVAAIASLYYIVKLDMSYAIMSMMALFSLTNGSRAKSFREQGMERQSKWMLWISLFFGIAFVAVLFFNIMNQ